MPASYIRLIARASFDQRHRSGPDRFSKKRMAGLKTDTHGDIKELMLDKNGKVNTVAIGVGGFLGMGERDVAVKFDRLKWSNEPVKSTSSGATTTTGSAQSQANRDRNYPDHAVLDATKDQLKAMPQFDYNK
jgi:hypothetical protein